MGLSKNVLLSVFVSLISFSALADKMTYEQAMQQHRQAFGQYRSSVNQADANYYWLMYGRPIEKEKKTEGLQQVWSSSAGSSMVKNVWGNGAYLIELNDPYTNATVGALWLYVDGSSAKKSTNGVSGYSYKKAWSAVYENGYFKGAGIGESTPNILNISKLEYSVAQ